MSCSSPVDTRTMYLLLEENKVVSPYLLLEQICPLTIYPCSHPSIRNGVSGHCAILVWFVAWQGWEWRKLDGVDTNIIIIMTWHDTAHWLDPHFVLLSLLCELVSLRAAEGSELSLCAPDNNRVTRAHLFLLCRYTAAEWYGIDEDVAQSPHLSACVGGWWPEWKQARHFSLMF